MTVTPLFDRTEPAETRPVGFPFSLRVSTTAAFLNAELVDHPVYDGIELQRFDDDLHGRGLLAFLCRRDDRLVDYYVQPGVHLDRDAFAIAGGTGRWVETETLEGRLEVSDLGVHADVTFRDVDGRRVEVRVDDRLAGRRHPGVLLAPVGVGVEHPRSLLLVYLHGFDLVRRAGPDPVIAFDGVPAATGRLPGARLHRRHLIKYAAPLTTVEVCPAIDGPLADRDPGTDLVLTDEGRAVASVVGRGGRGYAELAFDPPVPSLTELPVGQAVTGLWHVVVDGATITGGTWCTLRRSDNIEVRLDVSVPWRPPAGLPWVLRVVTRAVPTFRRWPTTYRWRGEVRGSDAGGATLTSHWERTSSDRGEAYRRATS